MRYRRATEQVWRRNRERKSGPRDRPVTGAERLLVLTGTNGVSLNFLGVTDWVTRCTRIYDCAQNRVRSATAGTKERNCPGGACPEYWRGFEGDLWLSEQTGRIARLSWRSTDIAAASGILVAPVASDASRHHTRGALDGAARDFQDRPRPISGALQSGRDYFPRRNTQSVPARAASARTSAYSSRDAYNTSDRRQSLRSGCGRHP